MNRDLHKVNLAAILSVSIRLIDKSRAVAGKPREAV